MCHAVNYYKHSLESIYITMDFYRTFDDNRERDIILSITHCFIEAKGWHPLYFFQKCITFLWISYKSLIFQRSDIPYKSGICFLQIFDIPHIPAGCQGHFLFPWHPAGMFGISKIRIECKGHLSGICMGCFTFLYDKSSICHLEICQ